jgi:hypothetical protein
MHKLGGPSSLLWLLVSSKVVIMHILFLQVWSPEQQSQHNQGTVGNAHGPLQTTELDTLGLAWQSAFE